MIGSKRTNWISGNLELGSAGDLHLLQSIRREGGVTTSRVTLYLSCGLLFKVSFPQVWLKYTLAAISSKVRQVEYSTVTVYSTYPEGKSLALPIAGRQFDSMGFSSAGRTPRRIPPGPRQQQQQGGASH